MKFTLLVVGRTVEKHYITAINDYVERTKHFISFDMEVSWKSEEVLLIVNFTSAAIRSNVIASNV